MKTTMTTKTAALLFWISSLWFMSTATAGGTGSHSQHLEDGAGGMQSSSGSSLLQNLKPQNTHSTLPQQQRERRPRPLPQNGRKRKKRPKRHPKRRPKRPQPEPRPQSHRPRPRPHRPYQQLAPERCDPFTVTDILLSGSDEVPRVDELGFGLANVTLCGDLVCLQIEYFDLTSPVTGVHIHMGLYGENGEVILDLEKMSGIISPLDGCMVADADIVSAIQTDLVNFYIDVKTREYPNGEIRGQIDSGMVDQGGNGIAPEEPEPTCVTFEGVVVNGDEQVPPSNSTGEGKADVFLCENEICITVETVGLWSSVGNTTINIGFFGEEGPIVIDFGESYSNDPMVFEACVQDVDDFLFNEMLNNPSFFYIDVDGELRGQLEDGQDQSPPPSISPTTVPTERCLEVGFLMTADQVVPISSSVGAAYAYVSICEDTICVEVEAVDLSSNVTTVAIYSGFAGEIGPQVLDLTEFLIPGETSVDTCVAVEDYDPELVASLSEDPAAFYVEVRTENYADGEIRGQIV